MNAVSDLQGLVLPLLSTAHLLFLLETWPGLGYNGLIMEMLCSRDVAAAIRYLLTLPYSHGHRERMKYYLRKRLRLTPVHEMNELVLLFPRLTATVEGEDGVLVPFVGPVTDLEAGIWDSHDFFFGILHAKKMEGMIPFTCYNFCMSFTLFRNARLHFL